MTRLALQKELAVMRAELAAEEYAVNAEMAKHPEETELKKAWLEGRARLRRELAELSQRLVEARAETTALQGEIAELLDPPMAMLNRQIFQQRAQLITELEDAILLRARKQELTELKRAHEEDQGEWFRRMLQACHGQVE